MIVDFDDFCTWMYVLISDLFAPIAPLVARPGPAPICTDAELITMAIVGECCDWDQETVLLSHWREHRDLFPHQPERTRFNRRRRDLAAATNLLRQAVLQALDLAQDMQCIIDSLPVPWCSSLPCPRPVSSGKSPVQPLGTAARRSRRSLATSSTCSSPRAALSGTLSWLPPISQTWRPALSCSWVTPTSWSWVTRATSVRP